MAMTLKTAILSVWNKLLAPIASPLQNIADRMLQAEWDRHKSLSKNPLQRAGAKFFSQSDEDGITLEILRRLKIEKGLFFEFGIGDGRENNTLALLALGWRGVWCGGEEICISSPPNPKRLVFLHRWIDAENVVSLFEEGMARLGGGLPDVISLDLDGNDLELARRLLAHDVKPYLFITEYNGRFPPGVEWSIQYDRNHNWQHDDYMGASLQSFVNLFESHGYQLVACNLVTGANAFFVRDDVLGSAFDDVPRGIETNFVPLRIHLFQSYGHPVSPKTLEGILTGDER